jgi:hypothetical protein
MSFREKIHWISFVSIVGTFGWYFWTLPTAADAGPQGLWASAGLLLIPVLGITAVMTIGTIIFALRNPKDAKAPDDERDRSFQIRATHLAYYPMVVGSWLCIGLIFGGVSQPMLLRIILAMVVVAELIRIGAQIYFYRRGY